MILQHYELDEHVMRTTKSVVLLKIEQGLVEVGKDTLAVAVKLGDKRSGFVLHGRGNLVLDAIVETEEGAAGEPLERELDKPFLMLGDATQLQGSLTVAEKEDLEKANYEDQKQFLEKAESLLGKLGERGRIHGCGPSGGGDDSVFAFPNESGKLDILVANGSRLVYKSVGMIFVADGDKTLLKIPGRIVLSKPNRRTYHCM